MPQMAPLSWIFLYLIFTLALLMFNSMNYFNYLPFFCNKTSSKSFSSKSLNWKW